MDVGITAIIFFASTIGTCTYFVLMSKILPNRATIARIVLVSLVGATANPIKHFIGIESTGAIAANILFSLLMLVFFFLHYQGRIWKKIAVIMYFTVIWMSSDLIGNMVAAICFGKEQMPTSFLEIDALYALSTCFFGQCSLVLFGSLSVLIWKRISAKTFHPFLLSFLAIPIGQMLTMYGSTFPAWAGLFPLGVFITLAMTLVLLSHTLSQEKRAVMEKELREVRYQMELEQTHYREIEAHRDELSKIRHDFNNQLATIAQLARSGESDSAQAMIGSLVREINSAEKPRQPE